MVLLQVKRGLAHPDSELITHVGTFQLNSQGVIQVSEEAKEQLLLISTDFVELQVVQDGNGQKVLRKVPTAAEATEEPTEEAVEEPTEEAVEEATEPAEATEEAVEETPAKKAPGRKRGAKPKV